MSKRKRNTRRRKRRKAATFLAPDTSPPGRPADYIEPFAVLAAQTPGVPVVVVARVSGREQRRNGHLDDQAADLRRVVEDAGATFIDVVTHTGSGVDPSWLAEAVAIAREHPGPVAIAAETVCRFIRPADYHSKHKPDAQPSEDDLEKLPRPTEGIVLATILPPSATPSEARSYHRKRGQRMKKNRGGRPKKTEPRDLEWQRFSGKLKVYIGIVSRRWGYLEISQFHDLPISNVRRWGAEIIEEYWEEILEAYRAARQTPVEGDD